MTRYQSDSPPQADRLFYEHSGDGMVYLYFDYDPTVIEAIRFAVPQGQRRWNPEWRRWEVAEEFWPRLRQAMIAAGVFTRSEVEELSKTSSRSPYADLHLTGGAPAVVVDASYRALAKLYHPDYGDGSEADRQERTRAMVRINRAYELIKEGKDEPRG